MSFWFVGDEEPEDPRFRDAGIAASGLYNMAGARCMRQVRDRHEPLPAQWFVPDHWVKAWFSSPQLAGRAASRLVRAGLWERVDGGYGFAWLRDQNTPDAIRRTRKRERDKKQAQRSPMSPGDRAQCPQGTYRGDIDGSQGSTERLIGEST